MRAAKYRKDINLPFGFSAVSDGYALLNGCAEQCEYIITESNKSASLLTKITNLLTKQNEERFNTESKKTDNLLTKIINILTKQNEE